MHRFTVLNKLIENGKQVLNLRYNIILSEIFCATPHNTWNEKVIESTNKWYDEATILQETLAALENSIISATQQFEEVWYIDLHTLKIEVMKRPNQANNLTRKYLLRKLEEIKFDENFFQTLECIKCSDYCPFIYECRRRNKEVKK